MLSSKISKFDLDPSVFDGLGSNEDLEEIKSNINIIDTNVNSAKDISEETNELVKAQNQNIDNVTNTTINIGLTVQNLNMGIKSVSNAIIGGGSSISGYGTGLLGDITYDPNNESLWPSMDMYGRYIWNCANFTLPEGVTMTPPEKCNGLYIYCTDTCTINGTIDMKNKRLTLNTSNSISNFVIINGKEYLLAKGGNTVKGGNGGGASKVNGIGNPIDAANNYAAYKHAGGKASDTTNAGNINGGGTSSYGTRAIPYNNGEEYSHMSYDSYKHPEGSPGKTVWTSNAPGAIILIAKNIIIGENGILDCVATNGSPSVDSGTNGVSSRPSYSNSVWTFFGLKHGTAGDGAQAPSGGGPITVITESFTNNGRLLNNGHCFVSPLLSNGTTSISNNGDTYCFGLGGDAGEGGTFISEAGEIKVYIVGGAN